MNIIIFSKNRACQLEALLRSMKRFFKHPHEIYVFYTSENRTYECGYERLRSYDDSITWVREAHFKSDLLHLIQHTINRSYEHLMFLVDDVIFTREFRGETLLRTFDETPDILGLSLRMGENITYCYVRDIPTTPPTFQNGHQWEWRIASDGYWNYPMSQDGHIFRLSELETSIANLEWDNPNSLESAMAGNPIDKPYMMCDQHPYLINLALNRVHDTFPNRHGDITEGWLNMRFLQGLVIDIDPIVQQTYNSCHAEVDLKLYPESRTRLWREMLAHGPCHSSVPHDTTICKPVRPEQCQGLIERRENDGMLLFSPTSNATFSLNPSARAIWELCDGQRTVPQILQTLQQHFDGNEVDLHADLLMTLRQFHQRGLLTCSGGTQSNGPNTKHIDLRDITFYVINCREDVEKRARMENHLQEKQLKYEFVTGITCTPTHYGTLLSHLKVLRLSQLQAPFVILEDDCQFTDVFRFDFEVPEHTDALYLGISLFGLETPGEFSWGVWGNTQYVTYNDDYLRVLNMLGRHAIVYLSDRYHQSMMDASFKALMNPDYPYPGDIAYAMLQPSHMVLTPHLPWCHQHSKPIATTLPLPALRELGDSELLMERKCTAAMASTNEVLDAT